jgi:hypothetical protein
MTTRPVFLALLASVALASCAGTRALTKEQIIDRAITELRPAVPWIDDARIEAHKGQASFGWTVIAHCRTCKTAAGEPLANMAIIKLDREGDVIDVTVPQARAE